MTARAPAAALAVALVAAGSPPLLAQYVEESETLRDHRARDEAYAERVERQAASPFAGDAEEVRRRFLETAERLIRDKNFDAAEGRGFVVRTDDPRVEPQRVAELLDAAADWFDAWWTPLWPPPTEDGDDGDDADEDDAADSGDDPDARVPVYMFWSFAEYNQLLEGDFSRSLVRPQGHYADVLGALVTHSDAGGPGDLPDLMVHELTHRLAHRRLGLGHENALPWVVEGLASWVGYMHRTKDGAFEPARVGGKNVSVFEDARPERPRESVARLQRYKRLARVAVRSGEPLAVPVLRLADPAAFYSGDTTLHYAIGWIAVHFALFGDDGAHREAFVAWLRRGDRDPDGYFAAVGLEPAALEAALAEHAARLPVD